MPNQPAIRAWYIALKSGDYKQGRLRLRVRGDDRMPGQNDKFCCWGVACDISGVGEWNGVVFNGKDALPPNDVYDWLGISGDVAKDGQVKIPEHIKDDVYEKLDEAFPGQFSNRTILPELAELNDAGVPFDQIADVIWYNYGEGDPPQL